MGLEKAVDLWLESDGFEAVLVTDTGELYMTEGLEERFALTEEHREKTVWVIER